LRRGAAHAVLALLAVAALLASALPGAAQGRGTFSGRPGLIAFDAHGAVRTISPRGGGSSRLATGHDPAFSPNGKSIVFVEGNRDLVVMGSDGSDPHTVYSAPSVGEPCFSADGRKLFFTRDTSHEGYSDIYSVPLAGGSARRLTQTGSRTSEIDSGSAAAAPNGRFVVYQRNGDIWTMRPDGSRQRFLAPGITPSISPNSRQIVASRGGNLVLVGAGGGGERLLQPFDFKKQPEELTRGAAAPVFSPDGSQIAFTFKRTTSYGPGLNLSKRLAVLTLRSGKTRILSQPDLGGSNADWQPLAGR
jgi:Tol biopolymer transport system component